jgi:hypothetical protein
MMREGGHGRLERMAPALTLLVAAPMFAEVLPGATRLSSIFVFPIEMAVWGGGALMARALVRSRGLGWWSLLFLGLALSFAEEFLIQQTSVAPMVIRLKGETWARAFGLNYVYLIWALVYESAWVVLLPTLATELMFPGRRDQPWLGRTGAIVAGIIFAIGSFLAWFTWTQMARTKVFHQPPFVVPAPWALVAVTAIIILVLAALRAPRRFTSRTLKPPLPSIVAVLGASWAVLWFALAVLAFGIAPHLPAVAVAIFALFITLLLLFVIPLWLAHPGWGRRHDYALLAGALAGSMAASFVGFIGPPTIDLWFKIIVDIAALGWLAWLLRRTSGKIEGDAEAFASGLSR